MAVTLPAYRGPRGQASPRAKVDDATVDAIRADHERFPPGHSEYMGLKRLARRYHLSRSQIQRIVRYEQR